jgi:hypothetical protein
MATPASSPSPNGKRDVETVSDETKKEEESTKRSSLAKATLKKLGDLSGRIDEIKFICELTEVLTLAEFFDFLTKSESPC